MLYDHCIWLNYNTVINSLYSLKLARLIISYHTAIWELFPLRITDHSRIQGFRHGEVIYILQFIQMKYNDTVHSNQPKPKHHCT